MIQRKRMTMRFTVVALAVGMLSPSVSIQDNGTAEVSILNAAQARVHANHNRKVNHNVNRNRNVNRHGNNYNHGGNYNHGRHYDNHHDHTAAKVIGGAVAGAVIVDAVKD